MKRFCWIGILVLLILAACNRPDDNPVETRHGTSLPTATELSAIDSLMWRQPDSALACLIPYFDTCCRDAMIPSPDDATDIQRRGMQCVSSTYNRHYANLLLSELLYKNDYAQTNRPALLQAVRYFDSLILTLNDTPYPERLIAGRDPLSLTRNDNLVFLNARAHYINGVGYYENDSVVEACKEYLKAMEIMENHFKEKDLVRNKAQFMALAHTRLIDIFSDLYIHEPAIYFARCSLPYYKKQKLSSWNLSWVLNEIGSHYDMMNELDSAECYYQKAITAIQDTNILMFRDIAAHQAYLKYKKGSLQAIATIQQLKNLLSISENTRESMARRACIGEVYYREKQLDSAWYYLNMVYCETPSISTKKQAAEWLVEICKTQGRAAEMSEYAEFLVPFASQEENKSGIKSQLTQLYTTFVQTKTDRQHQLEANKKAKQVITVIGSLLLVLLMIFGLYIRNKRHKRELETQIETERHSHKMQQAALAGRLRQSNAALKAQSKMLSPIAPLSNKQNQNEAGNYVEEPVCQQILAICNDKSNPIKSTVPISAYADIALNDVQKAQLKEAAMKHYNPLFEKLRRQYPNLKEKDFQYCYLCLLGLDNVQISVLLQNSISTIWERENRLKKIFGTEDKVSVILHGFLID